MVIADVAPSATEICRGESVTLNGSGTQVDFCQGGNLEFRWLADTDGEAAWRLAELRVDPDTAAYSQVTWRPQ